MKPVLLALAAALATVLKLQLAKPCLKWFAMFPHFQTPLTSIREVRELLYNYQHSSQFYSLDSKMQIGQSELLLKAVYVSTKFVQLETLLVAFEFALTVARLVLVARIVRKEQRMGAAMFVLLNPMAIFGQGLYNIGTFNDLVFTVLVYLVLTAT